MQKNPPSGVGTKTDARLTAELWSPDSGKFFIPVNQHGRMTSTYVRFSPVRAKSGGGYDSCEKLPLLMLEDDLFEALLYPFFSELKDVSGAAFDPWGENICAFDVMESVLEKIEKNSEDPDLPESYERPVGWCCINDPALIRTYWTLSDEEKRRFMRVHSYAFRSFYRDFCGEIRNMMCQGQQQGYNPIVVAGP